jgi:hypothetical protein
MRVVLNVMGIALTDMATALAFRCVSRADVDAIFRSFRDRGHTVPWDAVWDSAKSDSTLRTET